MASRGSPALRAFGIAGLTAVAYFLAARVGYMLFVPGNVVALWPPAGVTLGLLLLSARRDWVAIAAGALVGSFASDLVSNYALAFSVAASIANVLESLVAAWLITRFVPAPVRLTTVRAVVVFLLAGVIVSNSVTSLGGALALRIGFQAPFHTQYFSWWIGDGLGMLVVTPLLLAWNNPGGWWRGRGNLILFELMVLLALTVLAANYAVGAGATLHQGPGGYVVFPLLFWAALRFGPRGAATAALIVAAVATHAATVGQGPFVAPDTGRLYVPGFLYLYLAVVSVTSLLAAAAAEERQESSHRHEESEERYRSVADSAIDVILTIDEEHRIEYVNAASSAVFGYSPDELIGRSLLDLMPEDQRDMHRRGMERYLATGVRHLSWRAASLTGLHRDGHTIPLEISFGELRTRGRRGFTGIIRDVTQKRALEARYAQAQKLEALGQLAGGIAHDFNNLLAVIRGYATMLRDDIDPQSASQADVAELLNTTERATNLTRQLLAFSRQEPNSPRLIDYGDTVVRMAPILRRLMPESVTLQIRADSGHLVVADPGQMEQVLLNLVVNARDAMRDGGTVLVDVEEGRTPTSADRESPERRTAVLVVSDTGVGVPPDVLPRIFEPFFTTKAGAGGTGLGLATVHGIVTQHGGGIDVASEVGRGTTFRVWLPAATRVEPT